MPTSDSKSARIRSMHDAGFDVSQIAEALGIRYQHAYNVVQQYKKTAGTVGYEALTPDADHRRHLRVVEAVPVASGPAPSLMQHPAVAVQFAQVCREGRALSLPDIVSISRPFLIEILAAAIGSLAPSIDDYLWGTVTDRHLSRYQTASGFQLPDDPGGAIDGVYIHFKTFAGSNPQLFDHFLLRRSQADAWTLVAKVAFDRLRDSALSVAGVDIGLHVPTGANPSPTAGAMIEHLRAADLRSAVARLNPAAADLFALDPPTRAHRAGEGIGPFAGITIDRTAAQRLTDGEFLGACTAAAIACATILRQLPAYTRETKSKEADRHSSLSTRQPAPPLPHPARAVHQDWPDNFESLVDNLIRSRTFCGELAATYGLPPLFKDGTRSGANLAEFSQTPLAKSESDFSRAVSVLCQLFWDTVDHLQRVQETYPTYFKGANEVRCFRHWLQHPELNQKGVREVYLSVLGEEFGGPPTSPAQWAHLHLRLLTGTLAGLHEVQRAMYIAASGHPPGPGAIG